MKAPPKDKLLAADESKTLILIKTRMTFNRHGVEVARKKTSLIEYI